LSALLLVGPLSLACSNPFFYWRGKPMASAVEESEEAMIEAIFEQLQKAEQDLNTVQGRVDRRKWGLAKASS
jgi:hypothetical protein